MTAEPKDTSRRSSVEETRATAKVHPERNQKPESSRSEMTSDEQRSSMNNTGPEASNRETAEESVDKTSDARKFQAKNASPSGRTERTQDSITLSTARSMDEVTGQPVDDWLLVIDKDERVCDIFCQSMGPFFVAGLGSIGAGLLLQLAQRMDLVKAVPQFLSVLPPLQGLKGNLDMTFTSRLTTMAHKGELEKGSGRLKRVLRNMELIQAQSTLVSLFAVLISFLFDLSKRLPFGCPAPVWAFVFLGSTAVSAMSIACAIMSLVMVAIVFSADHRGINPDNVAGPLAASLGDLTTIGMMLCFGLLIHFLIETIHVYISIVIIGIAIFFVPFWMWLASKDEGALHAAKRQWPTLLLAAILSSGAGVILELVFQKFPDLTAYQPLITGIAGNRAALQACRISSYLNVHGISKIPLRTRVNPFAYFASTDTEARAAKLLLFTAVPYQALFVFASHGIAELLQTPLRLNGWFIFGYLLIVLIQVAVLLFLSQLVVYGLWSWGVDPDLHAIPILTACGDFLGTGLLTALFYGLAALERDIVLYVPHPELLSNSTNVCVTFFNSSMI